MNIFALHPDPWKAARWHADKHVVKMILESVQMLYTAHWVATFPFLLRAKSPQAVSRLQKRLETPSSMATAPYQHKDPSQRGYRPVHIHHPCTVWVRSSLSNYRWLCHLALALAKEHDYRWPTNPSHSCEAHAKWLLANPPRLPSLPQTPFAKAMPADYKKHDPIVSYRAFYRTKTSVIASYTGRHTPHWLATQT
jgi:hypothetical protein